MSEPQGTEYIIDEKDATAFFYANRNKEGDDPNEELLGRVEELQAELGEMPEFVWHEMRPRTELEIKGERNWDTSTGKCNTVFFTEICKGKAYDWRDKIREAGFKFQPGSWYREYELRPNQRQTEEDIAKVWAECPCCHIPKKAVGFAVRKPNRKFFEPIGDKLVGESIRKFDVRMKVKDWMLFRLHDFPLPPGEPQLGKYDLIHFVMPAPGGKK